MAVTLGVRPGDDGTVVAVSGEVDVCTEASLQQALLRIMREHGARLLLDVSGVSFMDCAGLRALVEYGRLGARRSVARTRRRLRQLGVRRRHWASERRLTGGWAGLTDIEQATARLVAEGLTNQQIADQLFISTHTVAFHLRQMFRKLDISPRVDLARIALEHARPGDGETP